jgi:serine/threonine protein kinase
MNSSPDQPDLASILGDLLERRASGEVITERQIAERYPLIAGELQKELNSLDLIERATDLARRKTGGLKADAQLPGYRLISELDSGGQGVVWLATQISTRRLVAVKIVRGGAFLGSQARARFEREAAALAKVDHPNVVRLIPSRRGRSGSARSPTGFR